MSNTIDGFTCSIGDTLYFKNKVTGYVEHLVVSALDDHRLYFRYGGKSLSCSYAYALDKLFTTELACREHHGLDSPGNNLPVRARCTVSGTTLCKLEPCPCEHFRADRKIV